MGIMELKGDPYGNQDPQLYIPAENESKYL